MSSSSSRTRSGLRVQSQVEAAVDRLPERGHAEVAQRDPELEGAAAAGELEAEIGEVHLAVDRLRVFEEVGGDLEASAQHGAVADEQRADLDRLVEPLVRVERDRVGELDAGECFPTALARHANAP